MTAPKCPGLGRHTTREAAEAAYQGSRYAKQFPARIYRCLKGCWHWTVSWDSVLKKETSR